MNEKPIDPLASPPQDPVALALGDLSSMSLDGGEGQSQFSQKNLLRLAALTDSHRTLSLFTPSIRDAVFRAWAGPSERGDGPGANTPVSPMTPGLSRGHSTGGSTSTSYTFSDHTDNSSLPSRPSMTNFGSAASGLSMGAGRHSRAHANKRKKTRVINLRRTKSYDGESVSDESVTSSTPTSSGSFEASVPAPIPEGPNDELVTPPSSPPNKVRFHNSPGSIDLGGTPPRMRSLTPRKGGSSGMTVHEGTQTSPRPSVVSESSSSRPAKLDPSPSLGAPPAMNLHATEKTWPPSSSTSGLHLQNISSPGVGLDASTGGILEQAWMMKVAGEIARRAHQEKTGDAGFWQSPGREESPPPAYELRSA